MELHFAVGLSVSEAAAFLEKDPLLAGKMIKAARIQGKLPEELINDADPDVYIKKLIRFCYDRKNQLNIHLRDPLELCSEFADTIKQVLDDETTKAINNSGGKYHMGLCHEIWYNTKHRLLKDYKIDWFTPAEMNPFTCFD